MRLSEVICDVLEASMPWSAVVRTQKWFAVFLGQECSDLLWHAVLDRPFSVHEALERLEQYTNVEQIGYQKHGKDMKACEQLTDD